MIRFTQGNLLEAPTEALVNTVNTVGVMGKGIALMFREAFPENYLRYREACQTGTIKVGSIFATERRDFISGPQWIINFPTKEHWRSPSRIEWIRDGLADLRSFIEAQGIQSIALPPLGSGNGGLDWRDVRPLIVDALQSLTGVTIVVYEPTKRYQNIQKREGVEKLTPARALLIELVRRYWVLGIECTVLEVQKLAYFLERQITGSGLENPLNLNFEANRFGPFSSKLRHLLDSLDGSYLHCDKRLADAGPLDVIGYDETKLGKVDLYIRTEARPYRKALDATSDVIEGFESPLGMELLATVDWLQHKMQVEPTLNAIKGSLPRWPGGTGAGARKLRLFDDRLIGLALSRLETRANQ
ncbi:MAG: macro domain-containing protein [Alphaproteobacteria bacterium]|nr:macro domain-containing protein [Alphaproteobacteria bacterium]